MTVRLVGRPGDRELELLADGVARAVSRRLAAAETAFQTATPAGYAALREQYAADRDTGADGGYYVPGYQERGELKIVVWRRDAPPENLIAGILARATIRVPVAQVEWLLEPTLGYPVLWLRRLTQPVSELVSEVPLTIELFRLQSPPEPPDEITHSLQRYLEGRDRVGLSGSEHGFFAGKWRPVRYRPTVEQRLGVPLDELFRRARLPLPKDMSAEQREQHILLAYASFPAWIEQFMLARGVIEAEDAVARAYASDPIGRLDDVIRNPGTYKDKLQGADERFVAVLQPVEGGKEEKKVVSLGALRSMIESVKEARAKPLLHGYFKRDAPALVRSGRPDLATARSQLASRVTRVNNLPASDEVEVIVLTVWEFPDLGGLAQMPHDVRVFKGDKVLALRIGGDRPEEPAEPANELELLIPASSLGDVMLQVSKGQLRSWYIKGGFRELEHFTEALMIYGAVSTGGKVVTLGTGAVRRAGLRAAAGMAARGILTRQGAVLGGEVVLNLLLPAVSIWVTANRERLLATGWGAAVVRTVETLNILLAIYGLGRITLGVARLVRAKMVKIPPGEAQVNLKEALKELDDLIKEAEVATALEGKSVLARSVGVEGAAAVEGLAPELREAAQAAAELNPNLIGRTIRAETEGWFGRYWNELRNAMMAAGQDAEEVARLERALTELNKARRATFLKGVDEATRQARLAELGEAAMGPQPQRPAGAGELRQGQRDLLEELARRRRELEKLNPKAAAQLSKRMARLHSWMQTENALVNESVALAETVRNSAYLSDVAAEGGVPMLRRLWLLYRVPRAGSPLKVTFEEYVAILTRHFRGNYGEFEVAFRLARTHILLKLPDQFVTLAGTDLIAIDRLTGEILLIDNKALSAKEVYEVSALTRNLPKNMGVDIDMFAQQLAKEPNLPEQFKAAFDRLRDARNEIAAKLPNLTKKMLRDSAVQKEIGDILAKHRIRRVVTNAGGEVTAVGSELEAMGIELRDVNL